jgi:hypothetical protein
LRPRAHTQFNMAKAGWKFCLPINGCRDVCLVCCCAERAQKLLNLSSRVTISICKDGARRGSSGRRKAAFELPLRLLIRLKELAKNGDGTASRRAASAEQSPAWIVALLRGTQRPAETSTCTSAATAALTKSDVKASAARSNVPARIESTRVLQSFRSTRGSCAAAAADGETVSTRSAVENSPRNRLLAPRARASTFGLVKSPLAAVDSSADVDRLTFKLRYLLPRETIFDDARHSHREVRTH